MPALGVIEIGRGRHTAMRGGEQLFSCAAVVILGRRLIRVNRMAVAQRLHALKLKQSLKKPAMLSLRHNVLTDQSQGSIDFYFNQTSTVNVIF